MRERSDPATPPPGHADARLRPGAPDDGVMPPRRHRVLPEVEAGPRALARPVGRRIFLGLVGAGVAGVVYQRYSYREDDATSENVAVNVPLTAAGQPQQRETVEGQHPNINAEGRFRYYSVGDIPTLTERAYRLRVDGEGVDGSLALRHSDVRAFTNVAIRSTFRCVTGWRVKDNIWRGVRLRDVLDTAAPNDRARFVTFYAADGTYTESLTWEQARSQNCLLVWELDGEPLIREQGYPLRLIYPDMYGYKNIKWLARIEVKSTRDLGFWEANDGWEIDAYVYNPDHTGQ